MIIYYSESGKGVDSVITCLCFILIMGCRSMRPVVEETQQPEQNNENNAE